MHTREHVYPFSASWHDLWHCPSWFVGALQPETQRDAAPLRTCLFPAPGRHWASPSHFNYGLHCLKTPREKATHRFLLSSPHTHYLKAFTAQGLFLVQEWIYTHEHTASGGKIPRLTVPWTPHLPDMRRFQRRCIFSCCCPLNMTQMCHQSISLNSTELIKGLLSRTGHDFCLWVLETKRKRLYWTTYFICQNTQVN